MFFLPNNLKASYSNKKKMPRLPAFWPTSGRGTTFFFLLGLRGQIYDFEIEEFFRSLTTLLTSSSSDKSLKIIECIDECIPQCICAWYRIIAF